MCIFSQSVTSVNSTQIFARATSHASQYLVYQMNYESPVENAMILPIPVRQPVRDDSLRFIDLKKYEAFFHDLAKGFPYTPPRSGIGCSSEGVCKSGLQVFEVGNYVASFVPSLADFSRLDARFTLPEATWSKIPQYKDYGFAVFQLASGALKPHPMAFEFESASDAIYFPTLHIHDGVVHETEEFDHMLYLQHAGFDSRVYEYKNSNVLDKSTGLTRSKFAAGQFCDAARAEGVVDPDLLVHRRVIHGNNPNRDTTIATFGDPSTRSLNLRPWLSYSPWLIVVAAITWFFARRGRIRRAKGAGNSGDQTQSSSDRTAQ